MRKLSNSFVKKLNKELKPLMDYVLQDKELDLQIRDNYINVYYQGGNILKINPRSFEFDKFYFYTDCNMERKTHLLKKAEDGDDKAKHIIDDLDKKRDNLMRNLSYPLNHLKVECYFSQAKSIMEKWEETLNDTLKISHKEKQEQQQIAIANRNDTDYVVLDLEYAVSRRSEFAYNGGKGKKVPRFDIIAIHNGQLVVIELKKGMDATDGLSGVDSHIDCFNHTIGRDEKGIFIEEMKGLLKQKQDLGILDKSLKINSAKPQFIFAFADKNKEDKFIEFSSYCFKKGYKDDLIYLNSSHKLNKAMSRDYYYFERRKQIKYYYNNLNKIVQNKGYFDGEKRDFVLQNGKDNLFGKIQDDCLKYFEQEKISWWGENKSKHLPSGHLVSSQIHCLNHLFALRNDKDAVLAILNHVTEMGFDEVLPSSLDRDGGYIAFEFAYKNNEILGETDKGARRGVLCTSIDAMIVARKGGDKWLIPIEWKYTESYEKEDKTNDTRLNRYGAGIIESRRLKTPENGVAHSIYFQEPSYELMRQTILTEGLINRGLANNMFHLVVIPERNKVLRDAVEKEFVPMLEPNSKFCIIDPQSLLSPLESNAKYKDLITYLKTRYW
jgi:hypothetical protein